MATTTLHIRNMVCNRCILVVQQLLEGLGLTPLHIELGKAIVQEELPPEAKAALKSAGFTYRTVGSGETVTDQTPAGGAIVPNNASVVLYLGAEKSDTPSTVPDVTGKTPTEANKALTNAGLIMKVAGATSASGGSVTAISQNAEAGSQLPAGSVVTVRFGVRTTD